MPRKTTLAPPSPSPPQNPPQTPPPRLPPQTTRKTTRRTVRVRTTRTPTTKTDRPRMKRQRTTQVAMRLVGPRTLATAILLSSSRAVSVGARPTSSPSSLPMPLSLPTSRRRSTLVRLYLLSRLALYSANQKTKHRYHSQPHLRRAWKHLWCE